MGPVSGMVMIYGQMEIWCERGGTIVVGFVFSY